MKWEYKRVKGNNLGQSFMDTFNEMGSEGWELVAIEPAHTEYGWATFYFKRPYEE